MAVQAAARRAEDGRKRKLVEIGSGQKSQQPGDFAAGSA
jgi:hypothetical protein